MLFNSPQFLFCFLPIVILGFSLLGRFGRTAVVSWLAFMSLVFYAYWRIEFLALLGGSIAVNYACSRLIWGYRERPKAQKLVLCLGITVNLATLAYFKYWFPLLHFVSDSLGLPYSVGSVILPLGISFFTFTQIGYLIDLSQDSAEPQDFVSYVLFVTFFPHLIAGPILHHSEIMPQFARGRDFTPKLKNIVLGLTWFVLGLGKKVLIADRLAPFANAAFANTADVTMVGAWIGILNYALQLYFDFSGYSDMAIGLARMFSIEFPFNFDSPYKAASIIDFWARWHMTLTRYLTLYLYNPLAMWITRLRARAGKASSRKALRTPSGFVSLIAFPIVVTMFIAGIWHGAGVQFIVFGLLHGMYLTVNHAWRVFRREGAMLTRIISSTPVSVLLTFSAVLLGQLFFRATSTHHALHMLAGLIGRNGVGLAELHMLNRHAFLVFAMLPVVWFFPNTQEILGVTAAIRRNIFGTSRLVLWRPNLAWAGGIGALLVCVLWFMTDTSAFLYFQF